MTSVSEETARMDFAKLAAEHFAAHPNHWTFGEIAPDELLGLRWGCGNDCVLVVQLANEEAVLFAQIIQGDAAARSGDLVARVSELEQERADFIEAREARLRENERQRQLIVEMRAALAKVEQLIDRPTSSGWHHEMAAMPDQDVRAIRALLAKVQP